MAEEAMRSLGDRFFYFTEEGDYLPNGRPSTPQQDFSPIQSRVQLRDPCANYHASVDAAIDALFEWGPDHSQPSPPLDTRAQDATRYHGLIQQPTLAQQPPAPVSGGRGVPAGQVTVGLTLVVNGKTFPKIEGGQERWYTQRPGHGNNYSRYSDLVRHDKAKGLTPMPKASKAELATARRQQTFG